MPVAASTTTVPGYPYPQISSRDGNTWFAWTRPAAAGLRLERMHENEEAGVSTEIVIARHTAHGIEIETTIAAKGENAMLVALCATGDGVLALWTEQQGADSLLIVGDAGGRRTSIPACRRVWDASAVALESGRSVAGVIELEGRTPVLRFYRVDQKPDVSFACWGEKVLGNAWSVSMAPLDGRRFWYSADAFARPRFVACAGIANVEDGSVSTVSLPGTGFATMPSVAAMPENRAAVAWSEDKMWGCHEYDFKRRSRIRLAILNGQLDASCEDMPLAPPDWDDDEQQMPCSPSIVCLDDGLHVFFRRPRASLTTGSRVNDWGWQIWAAWRDTAGVWHEPRLFSLDIGEGDEPVAATSVSEREAALVHHSCSFDRPRTLIHSHRIGCAVVHSGFNARPAAASVLETPVQTETRPRLAKRPAFEAEGRPLSCYWGDLHRHSYVSKCIPEHDGSYRDHMRFAMAAQHFDFYSITDHIENQITEREWQRLLAVSDAVTEPGSFAAVYGFEGPSRVMKGHLNFHFLDREAAEFGFRELRHMGSLPEMLDACRKRGLLGRVMCIRHFHADGLRHDDILGGPAAFLPELDWAMEAVQGRGYSPEAIYTLLNAGFRFGVMGSSDHNRPPGHPRGGVGIYEQAIAGVWMEDLTRDALFDAFRQRRCFSTNGPQLAACIEVNDTFMGGTTRHAETNTIRVRVHPTTRLTAVRLRRDGDIVAENTAESGDPVCHEFSDACPGGQPHFYTAEIIQEPEPHLDYEGIAWTSPVWTEG